jgi:hypothetical protein
VVGRHALYICTACTVTCHVHIATLHSLLSTASSVGALTQPEHLVSTPLGAARRTQVNLATGIPVPRTHICCCPTSALLEHVAGVSPPTTSAAIRASAAAPAAAAPGLVPAIPVSPVVRPPVIVTPVIVPAVCPVTPTATVILLPAGINTSSRVAVSTVSGPCVPADDSPPYPVCDKSCNMILRMGTTNYTPKCLVNMQIIPTLFWEWLHVSTFATTRVALPTEIEPRLIT